MFRIHRLQDKLELPPLLVVLPMFYDWTCEIVKLINRDGRRTGFFMMTSSHFLLLLLPNRHNRVVNESCEEFNYITCS